MPGPIKQIQEGSLFHFTNDNALKKIIKDKTLKLFLCRDAKNAAVETMALYEALDRLLTQNEYQKFFESLKSLYKVSCRFDLLDTLIKERSNNYIICFTGLQDDEM